MKFFCCVCTSEIEPRRAMKASTCSKECATKRKNHIRELRGVKKCRLCGRRNRAKQSAAIASRAVAPGARETLGEMADAD